MKRVCWFACIAALALATSGCSVYEGLQRGRDTLTQNALGGLQDAIISFARSNVTVEETGSGYQDDYTRAANTINGELADVVMAYLEDTDATDAAFRADIRAAEERFRQNARNALAECGLPEGTPEGDEILAATDAYLADKMEMLASSMVLTKPLFQLQNATRLSDYESILRQAEDIGRQVEAMGDKLEEKHRDLVQVQNGYRDQLPAPDYLQAILGSRSTSYNLKFDFLD